MHITIHLELHGVRAEGVAFVDGFEGKIAICPPARVWTKNVSAETSFGCKVVPVRRRVELKLGLPFDGVLAAPPASYLLPVVAGDPYMPFNTRIVVDGRPGVKVYGLEDTHTIVVSTTQRVVMEGYQPPQLLILRRPLTLKPGLLTSFTYPIHEAVNGEAYVEAFFKPAFCEHSMRYRSGSWSYCLDVATVYPDVRALVMRVAEEPIPAHRLAQTLFQRQAFLARNWSLIARLSGQDAKVLAEEAIKAATYSSRTLLVFERTGSKLRVRTRIGVPLRLLLKGSMVYRLVEATPEGVEVPDEYTSYAFECRQCWRPIV